VLPSWPVRDAACSTAGALARHHPAALRASPHLALCVDAWARALLDTIWSVRETGAVAFGDAIRGGDADVREVALSRAARHVDDNIARARTDRAAGAGGAKAGQFIPPALLTLMTATDRAALGERPEDRRGALLAAAGAGGARKGGAGWGCCLDCMEVREGSGAEASDGCVYLLREVAAAGAALAAAAMASAAEPCYALVERHLPAVAALLLLAAEPEPFSAPARAGGERLPATVLAQLPAIFRHLNGETDAPPDADAAAADAATRPPPAPAQPAPGPPSPISLSLPLNRLSLGAGPGGPGPRRARRGTAAAKAFLEDPAHVRALHQCLAGGNHHQPAQTAAAAADCVAALSRLLGPTIFLHKVPDELRPTFEPHVVKYY